MMIGFYCICFGTVRIGFDKFHLKYFNIYMVLFATCFVALLVMALCWDHGQNSADDALVHRVCCKSVCVMGVSK